MTSRKVPQSNHIQNLSMPLSLIKGVGPKRAELLGLKGLHTVLDLFYFTPTRYEDRSTISSIKSIEDGHPCLVKGVVTEGREEKFYPSRKGIYRIAVSDSEGTPLELVWFRYIKPHLAGFSRKGLEITAYGAIKTVRDRRQMFHPDIKLSSYGSKDAPGFIPVYSSVKGLSDNALRTFVRSSLDNCLKDLIDPLPDHLLKQLCLSGLRESVEGVHFPPGSFSTELLNSLDTPFHTRLIFDRFFYLMLAMAFRKKRKETISIPPFVIPENYGGDINGFLGFNLTSDQEAAIEEIMRDFKSSHPMNRLLMGDVGTGKTAVAAIAAHITILNNRQAALMAPTQILAEQHFDYFSGLSAKMGFKPVLVTGDMKSSERKIVYQKIREMDYNVVIGTHSLISKDLVFADLGLAVIDEEHRFGVRQRAMMDQKGNNPHILAMTATPIPRSLAITLYGDMDISIVKEYPKGRMPVMTRLIDKTEKRWAFETLKECLASGRQAFVVCPVIEETEDNDLKGAKDMHTRLEKTLNPAHRVGIVHGRMSADERESIMHDFYKGHVHVLVATTIVEVGVHVSNATLMVIEHPERFGLAQLHQLRGRVGRGRDQGMCMLIMPGAVSEKTVKRLKCLAGTNDGFEIAQMDLELRGQGELTGLRQSGIGEIDPFDIIKYDELLLTAKKCAQDIIDADPCLAHPDDRYLRMIVESISGSAAGEMDK
jgi:ATP-dependent DNA helicase RecG